MESNGEGRVQLWYCSGNYYHFSSHTIRSSIRYHGGAPDWPLFSNAASRAARRAAGSLAEGLSPPPRASVRQLLWRKILRYCIPSDLVVTHLASSGWIILDFDVRNTSYSPMLRIGPFRRSPASLQQPFSKQRRLTWRPGFKETSRLEGCTGGFICFILAQTQQLETCLNDLAGQIRIT